MVTLNVIREIEFIAVAELENLEETESPADVGFD